MFGPGSRNFGAAFDGTHQDLMEVKVLVMGSIVARYQGQLLPPSLGHNS